MYFVEMSSAIAIFFGLEEEGNLLKKKDSSTISYSMCLYLIFNHLRINTVFGRYQSLIGLRVSISLNLDQRVKI